VHVSAIDADENSPSRYARTKGRGETAVLSATPTATILRLRSCSARGSIHQSFCKACQDVAMLPLIGGGVTRLQPVYSEMSRPQLRMPSTADKGRRHLRAPAAGSADDARDHEIISRRQNAGACWSRCVGLAKFRRCPAIRTGPIKLTRISGAAPVRQCGVGRGKGRGLTWRAWEYRGFAGAIAPQYLWRFRAGRTVSARNLEIRRVGKGALCAVPTITITY